MSNIQNVSMRKYNISKYRFRELYYYCLQYNDWKTELKDKCDTVRSVNITGMPISHNNSDVTQKQAMRRMELQKKCELIEQTAIETDADLYPYILEAVTNDWVTYTYLLTAKNIPCGKKTYYDRRKKFYWLLSKKI